MRYLDPLSNQLLFFWTTNQQLLYLAITSIMLTQSTLGEARHTDNYQIRTVDFLLQNVSLRTVCEAVYLSICLHS
jgi:hypothetical protein